jgi:hypothetical protein
LLLLLCRLQAQTTEPGNSEESLIKHNSTNVHAVKAGLTQDGGMNDGAT